MFYYNEAFSRSHPNDNSKLGTSQCQNCFNTINNGVIVSPVNRMNLFLSRSSGIP
jgi:hypothetical protein